jgi:nitroreductase
MSAADLTRDVWDVDPAAYPDGGALDERLRFLLRYAILAPSSHNSQPWAFAVDDGRVDVSADDSRWLRAADADRRELHVSVGCALANLLVAADRFGFETSVTYGDGEDGPLASVAFEADGGTGGDETLFEAMTARRTAHGAFADDPVSAATLDRLRASVRDDAIEFRAVTDDRTRDRIAELQAEGDRLQMHDADYRAELGHWIGTGALGASWLAARVGQLAVTYLDVGDREAAKNSKLVRSAPVVGVFVTGGDTVEERVRTGEAFERLSLAATAAGVAVHPMSQILERPDLKAELADLLDLGEATPQHLVRLGYDAADREEPHTPRWPVSAVER